MAKEKILVVEDEEDILELVRFHLLREGYEVFCADSGERALEILQTQSVDLLLLDLMLPGIDGFTVVQRVKSDADLNGVPIVMLTAKSEEADVVAGLELGAEDYIAKPFSPRILTARIRTVLRRRLSVRHGSGKLIKRAEITIDLRRHAVMVDKRAIDLTYTEFNILKLLAGRPGWAFSRSQIVDAVRGFNCSVTDRSVDVQIVGLRRKLGDCSRYIETVRGVGYRFRPESGN